MKRVVDVTEMTGLSPDQARHSRDRWLDWKRMGVVSTILVGMAAGLLLLVAEHASAAIVDSRWDGGVGNWSDAIRWSPDEVPNNNGSDVYDVLIDGDGNFNSTVLLDLSATIENLTVEEEDELVILPGFTLVFTPDAFIENRNLILANLIRLKGETQLFGGGTIRFDDSPLNQIFSSVFDPAATLDNVDNTIEGEGKIDVEELHNRHVIDANAGPGLELIISAGSRGVANDSLLSASNGTLVLQAGPSALPFSNGPEGRIQASGDSSLVFINSGAHVRGGEVIADAGAAIVLQGFGTSGAPRLEDVELNGEVRLLGPVTAFWQGGIVNGGRVVFLPQSSATAAVRVDGEVTLSGGGEVQMGVGTATLAVFRSGGSNAHLINEDNQIRGAGTIGEDDLQITNRGTIEADGIRVLTIDPNGLGFSNEGMLLCTGDAGVEIEDGPFVTSGDLVISETSSLARVGDVVQAAGSCRVDGVLAATGGFTLDGGVLSGTGEVAAPVVARSRVAPGASSGRLRVDSIVFDVGSSIEIELGGLIPGDQHDVLEVGASVVLGGVLDVALIDGFAPAEVDSFEVLTAASVAGAFDQVNSPAGYEFEVIVEATRVLLVAHVPSGVPTVDSTADPLETEPEIAVLPNPVGRDGTWVVLRGAPSSSTVSLTVYDPQGRRIRTLVSDATSETHRGAFWDARDQYGRAVPAGRYLLRWESPGLMGTTESILVIR